jgi:hypothetical protein
MNFYSFSRGFCFLEQYPKAFNFRKITKSADCRNYMRVLLLFFVMLLMFACSSSFKEEPNSFEFSKAAKLAELHNEKLAEVSGLAPSLKNPNYLWAHNDSGNEPEVYLIDDSLSIKLTCRLKGIENRDWEDIAVGPGPDATSRYVYVGDIGDNLARYNFKIVYRFEEPDLESVDTSFMEIENFDTIVFSLPDERKDVETLMVDPKTSDIFVISKREKPVTVYRIQNPDKSNDTAQAVKVASFDRELIVGGDISPDGNEILLKNIDNVYYWKLNAGEKIEDVFSRDPKILPYKKEAQGEAIAFKYDGSGYYTLGEQVMGEKSFLRFYSRKSKDIQLTGDGKN